MMRILRLLLSRSTMVCSAVAVLSLLIWWIGPLVRIGAWQPLESPLVRGALIAFIVLILLLRMALRRWRAARANRRLTDQLAEAPPPEKKDASPGEQKILQERFSESVRTLKQMRLHRSGRKPGWRDWLSLSGRGYLYELPWYVFIGAPGSGKTTALVNSGLNFPLADEAGPAALRGIGGTRNLDWWFTDEAVMIDTAGRYTTQDSHQEEDSKAWEKILDLLKKYRPRRPLNGVLLTVSASNLITQGAEARSRLASALRARLTELDGRLSTRLPVYVLVTKADLLNGFMEFFDDLGREQRSQVFGFTLDPGQDDPLAASDPAQFFEPEFRLLCDSLNSRLIARLQHENDPVRRAAIFGFPAQFASLAQPLEELLQQVFVASRYNQAPAVRGVYFTSGTQEGTPIDRVVGSLSRQFGLQGAVLPPQASSGRSYFLATLLKQVVFPEQLLAGANLKLERRRHLGRLAATMIMGLVTLGLLGAWGYSAWRNQQYLQSVEAHVPSVQKELDALPPEVANATVLAPVLQEVRDLWRQEENSHGNPPMAMKWGLYQGGKVDAAADLAHQRALEQMLLPQLSRRIEEQLRSARKDDLEYAYEALKSYVMLYQPQHFDAAALKAWMMLDWSRSTDRAVSEQQLGALEQQLDTLLAQGAPQASMPMDESLVRSVRAMLASYPLEERIFSRLKRLNLGRDVPAFSVAEAAGPSAPLVFARASGQSLSAGVPGIFTYDGYHQRFQQAVATITPMLADEEPWVLGLEQGRAGRVGRLADIPALTDRVRRLYLQEYVRVWEKLLGDIRIRKAGGVEQNMEIARIISGVDSPLANLLNAVVRETTLIPEEKAQGKVDGAIARAAGTLRNTRRNLEELFGSDVSENQPVPTGKPIESIVDDRFEPLRRLVSSSSPNQPPPLEEVLKLFNEVYVYLGAVDTAIKSRSSLPPGDVAGQLRSAAGRLPDPVRSMVESLSQAGAAEARVAQRSNLSEDLRPIADFCKRAIAGRYPFNPGSSRDVLPDDMGQMFGPGGLMDNFFQARLADLVDTSRSPWRYKPVAEQGAISTAALVQFERAARIREVFFRSGGKTPALRLDFKPVEMDATITQFILDVDGQLVRYAHGPVVPMAVQWPGPGGSNQVRLQLSPPATDGSASGLSMDGPWALFRLLEQARFQSASVPEKFFVTFDVGGRRAKFEVTANSVQHPLRLPELRQFGCPGGL